MRARIMAGVAVGVLLGTTAPALAQEDAGATDGAPVTRAEIEQDLRGYYTAEKGEAFFFVAIGVISAAAGGLLVATRSDDFSKGFGWSAVGFGAAEILGAGYYAFAVDGKLDYYGGILAKDPVEFKRAESEHIHGTTSRFVLYQLLELAVVLGGAGLAIYGFAADKPVLQGVGIAVGAQSAAVLVLDWFGGQRAKRYEERLLRFDPSMHF
jgi:MFS family permease